MWPKAEVKLSGVLPSWSRLRRRFALRRRATRLETGGGELPGLPQCFLGGSCAGVTCCAVCAGCQPVGAGAGGVRCAAGCGHAACWVRCEACEARCVACGMRCAPASARVVLRAAARVLRCVRGSGCAGASGSALARGRGWQTGPPAAAAASSAAWGGGLPSPIGPPGAQTCLSPSGPFPSCAAPLQWRVLPLPSPPWLCAAARPAGQSAWPT